MKYYSNEIVFRGHPDKVCDQISAALLKELIKQDPNTRAGIECSMKNELVLIYGEITTAAKVNYEAVAKRVLHDIGYDEKQYCIITKLSEQSHDIALGTNNEKGGAGDNGMMFGYACSETEKLLPKAMVILQEFAEEYDKLVHEAHLVYYPDGKAQITGVYDDEFNLAEIKDFTICYCNCELVRDTSDKELKDIAINIASKYGVKIRKFIINPTGEFKIGGSFADAGLTGRKIVVDAYESFANVGGGCMNGKDPTKVDFTAAHKARELASRFLKENNLRWCEVQISYAIGLDKPLAIYADSDKGNIEISPEIYKECTPARMIDDLHMKELDYEELAKFGHFKN